MSEYIKCCSVCGCTLLNEHRKFTTCTDCAIPNEIFSGKTTTYTSKHPKEYYEELSLKNYDTKDKWKEVFIETELSNEPTFSHERYLISLKNQKERDKRIEERKNQPAYSPEINTYTPEINIPKCPTCQSTNIKKISSTKRAVHGIAFGLLSKTAKSQFECLNCKYKW